MVIQSYISHAELLLRNYISADPFVVYTSIIIGIVACKTVYELSHLISPVCFKSFFNLSKSRQVEWSNRAISTFHAVYVTIVSFYFVFFSDLYSTDIHRGPVTLRSSTSSTFVMGVSLGYFLSDLGMIIWCYPSLGGMEYIIHHLLSMVGVTYPMLTGDAQIYTFMVLLSEATTPWINLRWYLDAAGMKTSKAYIMNGVVIFLAWLVARILLFIYLFYHLYTHLDQVKQLHQVGVVLAVVTPSALSVMNLMWFWKIFKGLKKTLAAAKRE
ncbi:uncharacterized protein LOC127265812 isoform X2 [Andrographis paniculata]|uniref:uncharacterized protein LOC127265812 isoform X2 n=1 Tax=Andrographis paniculata TaxID=175694 RepID=UPI0021E6DA15|nr:uncharacterized protein LOC127265812 isoform X2 [Andrographis paniculata]